MKRGLSVTTLLVLLVFAGPVPATRAAEQPKVIEISAKRFGFIPDNITLKKGEPVVLRLTSQDVTHGFFVRALKVDELIEPGKPLDVKVQPDKAGTFTVICHHFCGTGHGNMKMTVTVVE
ncbi:MAG TPA: cupredoxin domain-containing protein [Terriglobales bacterium]|nr:cupredoxin domain-containing protein [Terriglobales bacterium]